LEDSVPDVVLQGAMDTKATAATIISSGFDSFYQKLSMKPNLLYFI